MKQRKIRGYFDEPDGNPLYLGDEVYYIYERPYDAVEELYRGKIQKHRRDYIVYIDEMSDDILNWFYLKHCRGAHCYLIAHQYERNEPDLVKRIEFQQQIIARLKEFKESVKSYSRWRQTADKDIQAEELILQELIGAKQ